MTLLNARQCYCEISKAGLKKRQVIADVWRQLRSCQQIAFRKSMEPYTSLNGIWISCNFQIVNLKLIEKSSFLAFGSGIHDFIIVVRRNPRKIMVAFGKTIRLWGYACLVSMRVCHVQRLCFSYYIQQIISLCWEISDRTGTCSHQWSVLFEHVLTNSSPQHFLSQLGNLEQGPAANSFQIADISVIFWGDFWKHRYCKALSFCLSCRCFFGRNEIDWSWTQKRENPCLVCSWCRCPWRFLNVSFLKRGPVPFAGDSMKSAPYLLGCRLWTAIP